MANTKQYAWSDVKINLLGRTLVAVTGCKYKRQSEKEYVYGRGSNPLSIQSGNNSYPVTLMLLQSELEEWISAVKAINPSAHLTDFAYDIVMSYGDGLLAVTDIIVGYEPEEFEKGMEQNDKFMEIELPGKALRIDYNV